MQDKLLNIQDKEERWINAVHRKNIDNIQSKEEYYYEIEEFQVLFEDERIRLSVEYGNEYGVAEKDEHGKCTGTHTFSSPVEHCLDKPFTSYLDNEYEDKNLREYLRKRGFPITFKIWD